MEALQQLELDRVELIPVSMPPHKTIAAEPGPEVRLALCRAAVDGVDGLDVSDVEISRPGPSYTAVTLRALHDARPGDDLTFIVGADMACSLPTWREPESVLELATLGVAERDGVGLAQIEPLLADALPGATERLRYFAMPRIDISSTLVRSRVGAGRSVAHLVPASVAAAIAEWGLYA